MPRFNNALSTFLGGEVSPKAYGRLDLQRYASGCKEITNAIVRTMGGVYARPGSRLVSTEPAEADWVRNIPYNPTGDPEDAYNFVLKTNEITAIKVSDETALGFSQDIAYPAEIQFTALNTLYSPDILFPTFTGAQLLEVQFEQVGVYLLITHPDVGTYVVWPADSVPPAGGVIAGIEFYMTPFNDFLYLYWTVVTFDPNSSSIRSYSFPTRAPNTRSAHILTLSSIAEGATTVTASGTGHAPFSLASIGQVYRCNGDNLANPLSAYFIITGYTSSTVVTAYNLTAMPDEFSSGNSGHYEWAEGAIGGANGFFRALAYHDQRLVLGGTYSDPRTFWGSQMGDVFEQAFPRHFDNNPTEQSNADPYVFTLAATKGYIQWMSSGESLAIGTSEAEFTVVGQNGVFGSLDFDIKERTAYGSTYCKAVRSHNTALFIPKLGQALRDMVFDYRENNFRSSDLMTFAEHMPRKGLAEHEFALTPKIMQIAIQRNAENLVWCLDNNGCLYCMTHDRQQEIYAWHYHKLGGECEGEIPRVLSIAVLPCEDGQGEDLWLAVNRTIDGDSVIYIEKIGREFIDISVANISSSILDKPIRMDCTSMTQDFETPTSSVSGLDHLEGEDVSVVADGFYLGEFTVASGSITLADEYYEILVGLQHDVILETLPPTGASLVGVNQASYNRVDKLFARFYRTMSGYFGESDDNKLPITFRPVSTPAEDPTPMFTGRKELHFPGNYSDEATLYFKQEEPLPWGLDAVMVRGITHD